MIIYHGVGEMPGSSIETPHLCYSAGVMVLSEEHPREVLYRSADPILAPTLPQERIGTIGNVVFPTGIDRRDDIGSPDRFDVYYGMADDRIGVARLDLPDSLPLQAQRPSLPLGSRHGVFTPWAKGARAGMITRMNTSLPVDFSTTGRSV
jgi:predicted GH43/DUF377 family glycosyl hydrolase